MSSAKLQDKDQFTEIIVFQLSGQQDGRIGVFYHHLHPWMRLSLWEPRGPAERFQHNIEQKNPRIDGLKMVRTVSLYPHHHSPKVAQLSAKRNPLGP